MCMYKPWNALTVFSNLKMPNWWIILWWCIPSLRLNRHDRDTCTYVQILLQLLHVYVMECYALWASGSEPTIFTYTCISAN